MNLSFPGHMDKCFKHNVKLKNKKTAVKEYYIKFTIFISLKNKKIKQYILSMHALVIKLYLK